MLHDRTSPDLVNSLEHAVPDLVEYICISYLQPVPFTIDLRVLGPSGILYRVEDLSRKKMFKLKW
jgi:hypothetical protein